MKDVNLGNDASHCLSPEKCKFETVIRYHYLPPEQLLSKRLPISSVGEETGQLKLLDIANGNIRWYDYFEKRSGNSS